jgi:large subunit ribosomal protein L21
VGEEGGVPSIGQPYVESAGVTCEVVEPRVGGEKITIQKFKPKTTYKRKTGHRQHDSLCRVAGLRGG